MQSVRHQTWLTIFAPRGHPPIGNGFAAREAASAARIHLRAYTLCPFFSYNQINLKQKGFGNVPAGTPYHASTFIAPKEMSRMVSARPLKAEACPILCCNRRTGDFVFVDQSKTPLPGDLVAVVSARGFRVEIYNGQPFVGVIVLAEDYAHCFDLLPG